MTWTSLAFTPIQAVTCFVCGRAYGTASIGIHLKQCKARFLEEEAQKPPRERRPLPPEPSSVDYTDASTFTADALEVCVTPRYFAMGCCSSYTLPRPLFTGRQ